MINLLVDEAYAFDYLSILDIKKQKSPVNHKAWSNCYISLQNQFETEKWLSMIYSQEYKNMIEANSLTFDAVDKAKSDLVSAKYVDHCNYQRYLAKKSFQKKFFDTELNENKIGYDKYENSDSNTD